jgi:hypothetical protein
MLGRSHDELIARIDWYGGSVEEIGGKFDRFLGRPPGPMEGPRNRAGPRMV